MDVFAIDSSTGEITVIGSIDRESGNIIYELKVQVQLTDKAFILLPYHQCMN